MVAGLAVLHLHLGARPGLEVGPLYSLVIVVLSLTGHRLSVVVGTVLIQMLIFAEAYFWPGGWGLAGRTPDVTLSASFICLVAGLLLHRVSAEARMALAQRTNPRAEAEARVLGGMLRMCAWCKRIGDQPAGWVSVEEYLADHSEACVTHGICPECMATQGGVDRSGGPPETAAPSP